MKKVLLVIFLLLIAAASAFFVLRRVVVPELIAANLAPSDSVLFVQFPDLARTIVRAKKTAPFQIAHEPAVQAFFKKTNEATDLGALKKQIDLLLAGTPRELFVAVSVSAQSEPKVLAGVAFSGQRSNAEALLDSLKKEARRTSPAGKTDLIKHDGAEIETFTADKSVFASVMDGQWMFLANEVELLKNTLDRLHGKSTGKPLRDENAFKKSLARMPRNFEAMVFVQPGSVIARLEPILKANGASNAEQLAELKKIEAVSMATRFEEERMHDTMFTLRSETPKHDALGRGALALSATDAVVFVDSRLRIPENFDTKKNPALAALAENGGEWFSWIMSLARQIGASGGEVSFQVDFENGAFQPGLLVAVEMRDAAGASQLVQTIATSPGNLSWQRQTIDSATFYSLQLSGMGAFLSPVMTAHGKFVLMGLNPETLKAAIAREKSGTNGLAKNSEFERVEKLVVKPTDAFGYIDARALFQQIYPTAQLPLVIWLSSSAEAKKTVDPSKMPPADAIVKHLSPIVYSTATVEDGVIAESAGPITASQAIIGLVGGSVAAAALTPNLTSQLHQLSPGLPGQKALPFHPQAPPKTSNSAPQPPATTAPAPAAPGQ